MSSGRHIQELVTRLADGDRGAVAPAFSALWPIVLTFAARALPGADAEDAAQQAILKVFEQVADFDRSRPALPWVVTIVRFECRTARRKRERRRERDGALLETRADLRASPEDELAAKDLDEAMRAVMATLEPADARALMAAFDEGPRGDVAPATFRKRVQRALARLRLAWRARHGTE